MVGGETGDDLIESSAWAYSAPEHEGAAAIDEAERIEVPLAALVQWLEDAGHGDGTVTTLDVLDALSSLGCPRASDLYLAEVAR
jgi:hypothetical protein